jgi:hypothetical protein
MAFAPSGAVISSSTARGSSVNLTIILVDSIPFKVDLARDAPLPVG